MYRRGQGLGTETIVLFVLALIVLIVAVLYFAGSFENFSILTSSSENVGVIQSACETACYTKDESAFCNEIRELRINSNEVLGSCRIFAGIYSDIFKECINLCGEFSPLSHKSAQDYNGGICNEAIPFFIEEKYYEIFLKLADQYHIAINDKSQWGKDLDWEIYSSFDLDQFGRLIGDSQKNYDEWNCIYRKADKNNQYYNYGYRDGGVEAKEASDDIVIHNNFMDSYMANYPFSYVRGFIEGYFTEKQKKDSTFTMEKSVTYWLSGIWSFIRGPSIGRIVFHPNMAE